MELNSKGGFLMKIFKKVSAVALAICLFFGLVAMTNTSIVAKADTQPVKLYYLDSFGGKYGRSNYTVYIKINHNAQNKAVYLHYYTQNGSQWYDQAGEYVTTISDGSEIWKVTPSSAYGILYAIKYVGDGQTYWDNNNGNNYTNTDVLGDTPAIKLKRITSSSLNGTTSIHLDAVVKNLDYTKIVKVRYTDDNWATYQDVPLTYYSSISDTNNELWSGSISIDSSKTSSFKFCAYYTVNNTTYWDNNFGANYDINYIYQPY